MTKRNYDDPQSKGYGEVVSARKAETQLYRVGEPIDYTSAYGYPKRYFPVYKVDADGYIPRSGGEIIGSIKEEIVPDENGIERGRVYYAHGLNRKRGQLRFFTSPEALLIDRGWALWKEPVPETAVDDAGKEVTTDAAAAVDTTGSDAFDELKNIAQGV